jgi:hypothetical protein
MECVCGSGLLLLLLDLVAVTSCTCRSMTDAVWLLQQQDCSGCTRRQPCTTQQGAMSRTPVRSCICIRLRQLTVRQQLPSHCVYVRVARLNLLLAFR